LETFNIYGGMSVTLLCLLFWSGDLPVHPVKVIFAQLVCPLNDINFCLHQGPML
jgi:hypothetical protein